MVAAAHPVPAAGGSDASAHFCVTSGWRSRCTSLVRRWSQWRRGARRRWRLKLRTTLHGDRSSLHRGCGGGSHGSVTLAAWVPRLTPVVLVQDAVHDDKTVAWLLKRTLDERQREKEAEEAEVVKQLEDVLAEAEDKLLVALEEFRVSPSRPSWNSISPALKAAVHWHVAVDKVRKGKREGRRKEEEKEDDGLACSSCSVSGCCLRSTGCGFGGVYALVSSRLVRGFQHDLFLLDSGLESIARVVLVPTAKRDTQFSFSPKKASFVFSFPWLASAFHDDGTSGVLWYFL